MPAVTMVSRDEGGVECLVAREDGSVVAVRMHRERFPVPGLTFGRVKPESIGLRVEEFTAVARACMDLAENPASEPGSTIRV